MTDQQIWISIVIIALVTIALRGLPFMLFNRRQPPVWITKLGRTLPYAVMGMLVIYCLKGVSFASVSDCLPAILSVLTVVLTYIWKRNTLLSILIGTILYMVLVQMVF